MLKEKKSGGTIRITLLTSCQSGCDFCHLEGHKSQQELRTLNPAISSWRTTGRLLNLVSEQDIDNAIKIAQKIGLNAINLTGGEPTLHPELESIISKLSRQGFSVAMTTHAEVPTHKLKKCINAGLEWIIISLHSITKEQYLSMDLVAQDLERKTSLKAAFKYAERRLKMKLDNVDFCLNQIGEKNLKGIFTNTVLLSLEQTKEIITYCNERGILPRIQKDLNEVNKSQIVMDELIKNLNATCIKEYEALGDSSAAGFDYSYIDHNTKNTYFFRFKDFGEIYIYKMCNKCSKKNTKYCRENFYGIRLEKGTVRTCIDFSQQGTTLFSQNEFINQMDEKESIPRKILEQYQSSFASNS